MHILANQPQRLRRRMGNVALDLTQRNLFCAKAERGWIVIPRLLLELAPIDGASIKTRRRSSLQTALAQAKPLQALAEQDTCRLATASRGVLLFSAVNESI